MASSSFQPIQGMSDLTTPEIYLWQMVESRSRDVFQRYGFSEIRTPIMEHTKVFVRSLGETTDVVSKEMYSLEDRGGRHLSLRPEGTAGVIRHVGGQGQEAAELRLYYMGPMFRAERPQAGRKRQFHQVGVESLGAPNPASDAECIALQHHLFNEWGLKNFSIRLNTRGLPEDRQAVADGLRAWLRPRLPELCEDCRRRFDLNVLRVLDCKQEACQVIVDQAPPVTEFMSEPARVYLDEVTRLLGKLSIAVTRDPKLVRGLDYYAHTVWEITHPALGAQDAMAGGGRYRVTLGNRVIEGVGFAAGLERVMTALEGEGITAQSLAPGPNVWLVSMGDRAFEENLELLQMLRRHGIACGMDMNGRSMKAQMRVAGKSGAPRVIIRGESELENGTFQLKDMQEGTQEDVTMPELMARLTPLRVQ
ncbi:MAG: histidine--tRNA ligase [Spartobacteria bacterium]|nr:histidine--tRNA ligase [Spartobacteria bacterium]